jgi:phospholipid transport system substrate-binding protein
MRAIHKVFVPAAAIAALAGSAPVRAADAPDPATQPVQALDEVLLWAMKQNGPAAYQARYAKLKPVVEQSLDLPTMAHIAVGSAWANLSARQREALVAAFERLTVASYAHNFSGWSGQRFILDPHVDTRSNGDKIVQTQLVAKHSDPVHLAYRMHLGADGAWKVIDVYYNGSISELDMRKADFAPTLAGGGVQALIDVLNRQADKLAK